MRQVSYDAVIIGAGVAGSTAAILLAQAGWSVALVEQKSFPRRKVCGECISATNLPILDALGIGEEFRKIAGPVLTKVALFVGKRTLIADLPQSQHHDHPWGRALSRAYLDQILLNRAEAVGAEIWQPWRVSHVSGIANHYICALEHHTHLQQTLTAKIIILAHGSWQTSPHPAWELKRNHQPIDLFGFKANFSNSNLPTGVLPVLAFPGGYGGIVLGDHQQTTLAFCIRRDRLQQIRATTKHSKASHAAFSYVKEHCQAVKQVLETAQQSDEWLTVGPLQTGIRKAWQGGGLFAVGNVAGESHPIIGEGISMAIQSSWLLCQRLIASQVKSLTVNQLETIGKQYSQDWRQNFTQRIKLAALFAHTAMRQNVISSILPILMLWPKTITYFAEWCGKTHIPNAYKLGES